uniref:Biogenesis of lysosome-related organelles complex 1 subunit 2 n=1 Tax=Salix viminalis TaxID=40686 RepID=A0A6N2MEZ4_SALVM
MSRGTTRNIFGKGTNNQLELLEKMNLRLSEEYKGFGDVASGLRVYVDQLKGKSGNFEEYVHQIEEIQKQVTEFEAVISVLDKYVSLLESEVKFISKTRKGKCENLGGQMLESFPLQSPPLNSDASTHLIF